MLVVTKLLHIGKVELPMYDNYVIVCNINNISCTISQAVSQ